MFYLNADPESVVKRAAELSIEQLDRLKVVLKTQGQEGARAFYAEPFEIGISNEITRLMSAYAVLKKFVPIDRVNRD